LKNIVSKWATMGYRMALSGDKIVLEYAGEGEPDPAVQDLIPELTAHKAELLLYLQWTDTQGHSAEELRQAIRQARDWQDLSGLLDGAQAALERGEVSREEAEGLAILAAQVANDAAEFKLRAERRLGEVLKEMPKQHGARPSDTGLHHVTPRTLSDVGVSKIQSSRFQQVADVPEADACPCCGQAQWWDNAGRRTCQVCHPDPKGKIRHAA
jgi:hypothetical protein